MSSARTGESPELARAAQILRRRRVVVLSGAGISTESGIPDYRGPDGPRRKRPPIQYRDFVASEATRARYWARSAIGWPHFSHARPNAGHITIARLERAGAVSGIITQNVDRLHQAAGSHDVIELHGALAEVICLQCSLIEDRDELQVRLLALNPGWYPERYAIAPDGDADLPDELLQEFTVPSCTRCGGPIKPNVVLFGENVPKERVERAFALLGTADALLVVGSSLTVFSGYRFVERATRLGIPVVVANIGPTRADSQAAVRLEEKLGSVLPALADLLLSRMG